MFGEFLSLSLSLSLFFFFFFFFPPPPPPPDALANSCDVKKVDQQHYYCGFCCMGLNVKIVKENRERLDVRFRDFVLDVQIDKTTPEIMTLSTFELLYLLKLIRKERSNMYHHMHVYYRAGQAGISH